VSSDPTEEQPATLLPAPSTVNMINLPTKPLPRAAASHGAAGEVNIEDNVHIYPYFDISFSFVTKRSEVFADNVGASTIFF
jgi:hypothetical protein